VSGISARLRASLRLRVAVLGAATLLVVGATSVIGAVVIGQDGPFTGCLSSKIGLIYNVAPGTTPKAACLRGDMAATFSNAQGPVGPTGAPGKDGAPGQPGPGSSLMVDNVTNETSAQPGYSKITAACPGDEQVTGGGYSTIGLTINSSGPGPGNTWVVAVTNPTSGLVGIDVTAVCAWLE